MRTLEHNYCKFLQLIECGNTKVVLNSLRTDSNPDSRIFVFFCLPKLRPTPTYMFHQGFVGEKKQFLSGTARQGEVESDLCPRLLQ